MGTKKCRKAAKGTIASNASIFDVWTSGCIYTCTDLWIYGFMYVWMDACIDGSLNACMPVTWPNLLAIHDPGHDKDL